MKLKIFIKVAVVVVSAFMLLTSCEPFAPVAPLPPVGKQFNPNINYGSFTDSRDGKSYRTVRIGNQTWMAENLNYNASGSVCYDNNSNNCDFYGRLYNWATAMGLSSSCNSSTCAGQVQSSNHRGICPEGWHVPSDDEWETLVKYVDPNATGSWDNNAGRKLKARGGWEDGGNGTDEYGFSALPGGGGNSDGSFYYAGRLGGWWSATERDASSAWPRRMVYYREHVDRSSYNKSYLFSLRCSQD